MQDHYLKLVARFVAQRFPKATSVIVAGSTARAERTPTSDIDLLLLGLPGFLGTGVDSLATTVEHEGEAIEVFAYTPDGFNIWAQRGVDSWRPILVTMLIEGECLRRGEELDALRDKWAPVLARGPQLSTHDVNLQRYAVTDLLDDLADSDNELEQRVIVDLLFQRVATLVLLTNHRWTAAGKHLPRQLRAWDEHRSAQLTEPYLAGDHHTFAAAVTAELDMIGGRLHVGFVR